MQQIILLNLLGMCISFLLLCQYERKKEGDIEGLVDELPSILFLTIIYPFGIIGWCLINMGDGLECLFKDREWFWEQEK